MAKTKKKPAAKVARKKAASKVRSRTKAAPKSKKVKQAKPKKKAVKKGVAKRAAKKKVISKKPVARKSVAKKAATVRKKAVAKVARKKSVAKPKVTSSKTKTKAGQYTAAEKSVTQIEKTKMESIRKVPATKPVPAKPAEETRQVPPLAQINMFQMPNQRPIAHKPAKSVTDDTRTRYSDEELREFEALILEKLVKAREEYKILKDTLNRNNDEGTDATSGGNTKVLEDGAETAEKENLSQLAARQQKYITNLENALVRIKNGTYGICSVTGKLIGKERLIAVPHTTQSIEAKMMKQD